MDAIAPFPCTHNSSVWPCNEKKCQCLPRTLRPTDLAPPSLSLAQDAKPHFLLSFELVQLSPNSKPLPGTWSSCLPQGAGSLMSYGSQLQWSFLTPRLPFIPFLHRTCCYLKISCYLVIACFPYKMSAPRGQGYHVVSLTEWHMRHLDTPLKRFSPLPPCCWFWPAHWGSAKLHGSDHPDSCLSPWPRFHQTLSLLLQMCAM